MAELYHLIKLSCWHRMFVVALWGGILGGIISCGNANVIGTVRDDGLSLFRSFNEFLPSTRLLAFFEDSLSLAGRLNDSSQLNDWLSNELIQSDRHEVRRRLRYFGAHLSDEAPGRPEAVLLSYRLSLPVLVLILNESRRISPYSFLVNEQGVFPIDSLQNSGLAVPAIQLLEVDGLWHPITAGAEEGLNRNLRLDAYLAALRPLIENLAFEFERDPDDQLRQVVSWYNEQRRLLETIPDYHDAASPALAQYVREFRDSTGLMRNFYRLPPFHDLMHSLNLPDDVAYIGQLLQHGDPFEFVMDQLPGDYDMLSLNTDYSLNQLFVNLLQSNLKSSPVPELSGDFIETGSGLPIEFREDRESIEFNPSSYVDQLLLILHMRWQMLQFARLATVTFQIGLNDQQIQRDRQLHNKLINRLQAMIHALIKKHYSEYWGQGYYTPMTFVDGDVVLFYCDNHAPFFGWQDDAARENHNHSAGNSRKSE